MKNIFLYYISIFLLSSCIDGNLTNENNSINARSIDTDHFSSKTNPNLIEDWENQDEIVLNTTGVIATRVSSPWSVTTSSTLPDDFRHDVKKEDGWIMLFHTFKDIGLNPKFNYICLYNQFTGYLKVFYYEEGNVNGGSGAAWRINFSQPTSLFNLMEYFAKPENDKLAYEINISNMGKNPSRGIQSGWNGFEFEVPYTTDYQDLDLTIDSYDKRLVNYDFTGKSEYNTEGTIISTVRKNNGLLSTIAQLGGLGAKELIKSLPDTIGSSKLGAKVMEGIKSITAGNYASAISAGLNLLFGSTTATEQKVKLKTLGTSSFEGISESTDMNSVVPLQCRLHDIINGNFASIRSNTLTTNFVFKANTSPLHIGVWTLSSLPEVSHERFTYANPTISIPVNSPVVNLYDIKTTIPVVKYTLPIQINPNIQKYIVSSSTTLNLIACNTFEGNPYNGDNKYVSGHIGNIIYDDNKIRTYDYNSGNNINLPYTFSILKSEYDGYGSRIWYVDWGIQRTGSLIAVITCDFNFNINGKSKRIVQSRIYPVKYVIDETANKYNRQNLVNKGYSIYKYDSKNSRQYIGTSSYDMSEY